MRNTKWTKFDAWEDDDWEVQADKAAASGQQPASDPDAPSLTREEREAQHHEANRRLWESAETPTYHPIIANPYTTTTTTTSSSSSPAIVVASPFSNPVTIIKKLDSRDGGGELDRNRKAKVSREETLANLEERRRNYDRRRAELFANNNNSNNNNNAMSTTTTTAPGSSNPSSGTSTPSAPVTPPPLSLSGPQHHQGNGGLGSQQQQQQQRGRGRGRGGGGGGGNGAGGYRHHQHQQQLQQQQQHPYQQQQQKQYESRGGGGGGGGVSDVSERPGSQSSGRGLYDPNYAPKPPGSQAAERRGANVTGFASGRSSTPRDDGQQSQVIRTPRGPDGSGRGFAARRGGGGAKG
ncbi:hypothetical protein F4778DRAFT_85897 [Xylariomycetidae sp. FL2044]|nr:hypothetical protein F4778DRAFT_85897 [Xylariomycetidae sp. FL2044]